MLSYEQLLKILESFEIVPIENRCILVQFVGNWSTKIANYFVRPEPIYVLQICQNELILAELNWSTYLRKVNPLVIELSTIKKINIKKKGINYYISIFCEDNDLELTTQQKELTLLIKNGDSSVNNFLGANNWHAENLNATLKDLQAIKNEITG